MAWILTGALFIGNLFVGVVIDNFDKLRADERGRGQLTKSQMDWVAVQNKVIAIRAVRRPPRPTSSDTRMRLYDRLMSDRFENAVTVAIALNVLVLATTHWVAPGGWTDGERAAAMAVGVINTIFSALWLVEALLKMYGFGARCYLSFNWNRFDFFLVLCGISEVLINGITIATGTYEVEWVVELTMVLRLRVRVRVS